MNESDIQPPPKEDVIRTRVPRLSAHKALPQTTAETLVKIIKGYAIASNGGQTKINYKDVASVVGLSPTVVSANNKFLLESQILSSPQYGYYVPTENAVRFAREAAWDEPAAKAHLRKVIAYSWYGQVAVQNFVLRAKLTRAELKRSLAIKCGASEGDSAALEFLIDFMIYTDLVANDEKGGLGKGQEDADADRPTDLIEVFNNALAPERSGAAVPSSEMTAPRPEAAEQRATIAIHLHVHDFDQLTPENASRLRRWLDVVSSGPAEIHVDTSSVDADSPLAV